MEGKFKVKEIAKRTSEGGITPVLMGVDCDICDGLYQKKRYITHVVELETIRAGEKVKIDVCKTCLCEALAELDKRILED